MDESTKPSIKSSLRHERLLRGWSQQALADKLGTTIVTVSRWERGIQSPGPMMRLKLSILFEKTESELGLLPEESENVSSPSPQNSQDASISTTPAPEPTTDEAPEPITPAEPVTLSQSTQEADSALPYKEKQDTAEQAPERTLLTDQSPLKQAHLRFLPVRSSARWVIALAGILIVVLMVSLIPELHVAPTASSRASAVTPSTTPTTEPVPAPYGVRGHLVLDNALRNEHTGSLWYLTTPPAQPTGCHFLNDSYDMRDTSSNYCLASNTDYANFVYQIDMTTIQGQAGQTGGIVFRTDDNQDAYYDFQVGADGSYFLSRNSSTDDVILRKGRSSAIVQGDQQSNRLAVKAIGENLFLYVNFRLVDHVQDLSYTHGNIGIGVTVNTGETEVAFHDAKVWRL